MTTDIDRKKKLLIIGPLPPPYAGPEIGTQTLLTSELLRKTYEIRNINTTVRTTNRMKGKLDHRMFLAFIKHIFKLVMSLYRFRPDYILYLPTSATMKGWVRDGSTIIICRAYKVRIFLQFRGGHFRYFYDSLHRPVKYVIRRLLQASTMMIAQADVLKPQFIGILPAHKIGKLYNCVPQEFYSYFETAGRRQQDGPVKILFVGHLSVAKGYCDLLQVVPYLVKKHDARFHFMGTKISAGRNVFFNQATGDPLPRLDPDDCYRRFVEAKGIADSVKFLGDSVHGRKKLHAFEAVDIFVLPSYSEGFSMAVLEAMAAGLPVVVTNVGAMPEIITDGVNGRIIAPGNTKELCNVLEQLILDGAKRTELGGRARHDCGNWFLTQGVVNDLIEILESSADDPVN